MICRSKCLILLCAQQEDYTWARAVFQPGWRWTSDVKPSAGGAQLCPVPHRSLIVAGELFVKMADGKETLLVAGDVASIPSHHDAWVPESQREPTIMVDVAVDAAPPPPVPAGPHHHHHHAHHTAEHQTASVKEFVELFGRFVWTKDNVETHRLQFFTPDAVFVRPSGNLLSAVDFVNWTAGLVSDVQPILFKTVSIDLVKLVSPDTAIVHVTREEAVFKGTKNHDRYAGIFCLSCDESNIICVAFVF